MSIRSRRAGGRAEGAGYGQFPDFASGVPHVAGLELSDDFHDPATASWAATTIGGSAPTNALQVPGGWDEVGVHRLTTAAAADTGGVLTRAAVADLYRVPPPGATWACKLRMVTGTTSYDLWSGFASATASVRTADATQFVGVRQDRAVGANLYGVVKDGAASETVVDFGVSCEASAWLVPGFEVDGDTTTPTVQFVLYHPSNRGSWEREPVGSPISATMPTTNLFSVALGLVARAASARVAEVDFWDLGGRCAR